MRNENQILEVAKDVWRQCRHGTWGERLVILVGLLLGAGLMYSAVMIVINNPAR